jgi:anti-sigma regulatory factor (Ser/Thr protein kinase)
MPHADITLPGSASSVPQARHFVESALTSWGLSDVGWVAVLVVGELAANAALHAKTPFTVGATLLDDGRLRLEVSDGSPRAPQQRSYGDDATTGRGLRLVHEVSTAWGVETRDQGKTVWVLLDADGAGSGSVDESEVLSVDGSPSSGATPGTSVTGRRNAQSAQLAPSGRTARSDRSAAVRETTQTPSTGDRRAA